MMMPLSVGGVRRVRMQTAVVIRRERTADHANGSAGHEQRGDEKENEEQPHAEPVGAEDEASHKASR